MRGIIGLIMLAGLTSLLAGGRGLGNSPKREIFKRHKGTIGERVFQPPLAGQIVDYTANSGTDRRIWSAALGQKRDLYVYLPPGFHPQQRYPVMIWMHGLWEDEGTFFQHPALRDFDNAMASGQLPPMIIAVPDGSLKGRPSIQDGTLWYNSLEGNFEDFLVQDVWGFVQQNYPVRPERQAHVLAGISGGAGAAFRMGIRYRNMFGVAMGTHPPLNIRWVDCHGNYFSDFNPSCWGWRTSVDHGLEPVGRFYGVLVVRLRRVVYPLFGKGPEAMAKIIENNPIEMIDATRLKDGELAMYVAYAGKDEFNITAQVDSFLYRARQRQLKVTVDFDPQGHHDWTTADRLRPAMIQWLAEQMVPFRPQALEVNPRGQLLPTVGR
jgi:S-formylglutathione hydrolase FrmB